MRHTALFDQVCKILGDFAKRHGFIISVRGDLDEPRGVTIDLENDQLIISVNRERDEESILIHCKVRPRPRAHRRTYSIGALSAFVQGRSEPFPLRSFSDDAKDRIHYENEFLNVELLNSEKLRLWELNASRRRWGQKPKTTKE